MNNLLGIETYELNIEAYPIWNVSCVWDALRCILILKKCFLCVRLFTVYAAVSSGLSTGDQTAKISGVLCCSVGVGTLVNYSGTSHER